MKGKILGEYEENQARNLGVEEAWGNRGMALGPVTGSAWSDQMGSGHPEGPPGLVKTQSPENTGTPKGGLGWLWGAQGHRLGRAVMLHAAVPEPLRPGNALQGHFWLNE